MTDHLHTLTRRDLSSEKWTLAAGESLGSVPAQIAARAIPAAVPGCVHTDLLAKGLIGDPYQNDGEERTAWIGQTDWTYRCEIKLSDQDLAADYLELVCEGLDTVATVSLNGTVIGNSENMHAAHRFNAKSAAQVGLNELAITFRSPVAYAREHEARIGAIPHNYDDFEPYNFIRKMACNFGWDWGPTLITSGIHRAIRLESWTTARLGTVRPLVTKADERLGELEIHAPIIGDPAGLLFRVSLVAPDGQAVAQSESPASSSPITLTIDSPELWWPVGYGDQPLYTLTVELRTNASDGVVPIDSFTTRVGFRTIELDTSPDEHGSAFTLRVNGRPVFCRGANWIPDDCFVSRIDPARYHARLQDALDCNMNTLRVWGGGLYEGHDFYDFCDTHGILVWQDFPFACSCYPEEPPFDQLIEDEAQDNIARLARHPSLVLWCGGNECLWGHESWGWKERLKPEQTWGRTFWLDTLPKLCRELDPTTPYWPNSPWSDSDSIHPTDPDHGNTHTWDTSLDGYRDSIPRFLAEFGHQAPANFATLARVTPEDELATDSPSMVLRQRAMGGNEERLDKPLRHYFDPPTNFDDWHYLTQLVQARAVSIAVEWGRAHMPRSMGALYWQLNDCWPVHSWAAIDGDGRRKPLWFATRRFFADRLATIQPIDGEPTLFLINDTDEPWEAAVNCQLWSTDSAKTVVCAHEVVVEPRTSTKVGVMSALAAVPTDPTTQLYVVDAAPATRAPRAPRALWMLAKDCEFEYHTPTFDAELITEEGFSLLRLTARSLIRDIVIQADRLDPDAEVSDQGVTLLPGETWTARITHARPMTLEQLTTKPVFRCANEFGAI